MKASDNPFPSFLATETAAASISNPASGKQRLFVDTDHVLKYKNSAGTVSNISSGGGGVAADTIFDAAGDLVVGTGADTAAKLALGAAGTSLKSTGSAVAWQPGGSVLLYDYTVVGSDKASIDTGVDTPDAGIAGTSAFSGAFRILEIYIYARCDTTANGDALKVNVNNDTGATNYDRETLGGSNTVASASLSLGASTWLVSVPAASATAGSFGCVALTIHNYAGTVGRKTAIAPEAYADAATSNNGHVGINALTWKSTAAITRVAVAVNTSLKKLVVGSRLSIYAR